MPLARLIGIVVAALCLFGSRLEGTPGVPPPDAMYADATAKERAVRAALAPDQAPVNVLKAVRTVVDQYELLVRSYPTSGYCDDALWQGGQLSLDAYAKFGDARDKTTAVRLLGAIVSEYPASKFAAQVPAVLDRASALSRAETTAPPGPASPAVGPTAALPARPPSSPKPATVGRPADAAPVIATLKDIRRTVLQDVVRVIIELDGEVSFHPERLSDPARIFVDLVAAQATPSLLDKSLRFDGDTAVVRQIRLGRQANNTTRVVLEAAGVSSYSVYPLYNPYRLIIDCVRERPEAPAVPAAAAIPARPPVTALPARPAATTAVAPARSAAAPTAPPLVPLRSTPLTVVGFRLSPPELPVSGILASLFDGTGAPAVSPAATGAATATRPATGDNAPPPASGLPSGPATNAAGGFSVARQLGLGVSKIVIDPGHGGHDPGAENGPSSEAELVLDIALRLEKLLEKVPGVAVVLTRRTNVFVPLEERTAIANREHADLFLSIHANASTNKQARGVETYFLNMATNATTEAVAARENATSGQAMGDATRLINAILLNNKRDESRDLATVVQRQMIQGLQPANKNVRDLGVKQAPFVVLIGAAMPSVLSEVSFITNTQDAKLLRTTSYRQRIAAALFDAIRAYQSSLKSTTRIAAGP